MERFPSDAALKNLENELTRGGELAKQLQLLLNAQSSSQETHVHLLNEILNTYDRALSVIEYGGTSGGASGGAMVVKTSDSPGPPLTGSPHSNHSDPEDQACWIREYYRCTHGKGCLARKQVQRSDEDPTVYEVAYKGHHTCHNNPPIPIIQPQNELNTPLSHENQNNQSQQEPVLNIQTSLKIIDSSHDKQYNIPSSSNFNPENNPIFSDDQILSEDYLLDFMYPTAQELNYFNGYEGLNNNSQDIEPAAKPPTQDGES
ncbi:probable WRKY transcription factor 30 isoform X3 [Primulina eburnea]|uniref:probable WRKY transcription factor 30 isoform X3 n=1 Tax=Primulina eburnea TaxID=1245227 RepID=UPI003C6BDE90